MAYNKVIMVGRISSDIELKQSASGKSVVPFSIAVRKNNNNDADFFSCVAWEKTAQFIAQYFKKGDGIGIEGKLFVESYEKNGVKNTAYKINCEQAFFTEGAAKKEEAPATVKPSYIPDQYRVPTQQKFESINLASEEDLPF